MSCIKQPSLSPKKNIFMTIGIIFCLFFYLNSKCTELYFSCLGEYVQYQIQQGILLLIPGPHNILIYIPRLPLDIRSIFSQASGIYLHFKIVQLFLFLEYSKYPPSSPGILLVFSQASGRYLHFKIVQLFLFLEYSKYPPCYPEISPQHSHERVEDICI